MWSIAGSLTVAPATTRTDLLAEPVIAALAALDPAEAARCGVAEIDPDLADTAAFCQTYGSPLDVSANCVVVAGKRGGETRYAACVVLATTRADVNGVVRKRLDVRKASFAPMDDAVERTGMAYGGITPLGLPSDWPLLVDGAVATTDEVVVGSGVRHSKLIVPGELLTKLASAEVVEGLGRPVG
jgi:prolyl-tRNA editing enzyme YbaK/EbsC (Cys-tRNA(Pro) deacylase)